MLNVRGLDGASDPMEAAQRYLSGVSQAVQNRALVAGLRAYLMVLRKAAMGAAPFEEFTKSSGYRMAARATRKGEVRGYLYSAGYGNTLEAGAAGHYAPIQDTISDRGQTYKGLGNWLRLHAPEMLAAMGKTARFVKVKPRTGQPWVIPAADSAEGAATEAFIDAILDAIAKEVT